MSLTNPNGLNNLGRRSPKEHFCRIIWKSVHWFLTRFFFLSFLYRLYRANKPRPPPSPWRPCFLTNPNGLNNLGRGSQKEHFCKIIFKLVYWFPTKKFFQVFYIDIKGKSAPPPGGHVFFNESKK